MKVIDPRGHRWRVHRRRFLWRPRAMQLMAGPAIPERARPQPDRAIPVGSATTPPTTTTFELTGLPLAALEHLLLLVLLPPTLLARALGLLPWTVVARREQDPRREWSVRGSAEAKRRLAEVVHTIEQGQPLGDVAPKPPG